MALGTEELPNMKMYLPCDTDEAEVAGTTDNLHPGAKADTDKAEAPFHSTNPWDMFFPGNGFCRETEFYTNLDLKESGAGLPTKLPQFILLQQCPFLYSRLF